MEIKQGQKNDRRAKILGAESTINQALQIPDEDPHKQSLLLHAISDLNEGRESIIKEFEIEVNKQISIPNSKVGILFKSMFDEKFNEEISNSFNELNDQLSYIVKSSDLLAKTYSVTGHPQMVDTIFYPVKQLVEENHEYVSQLVELQDFKNDEESRQIKWCVEPEEFIAQIEILEPLQEDMITIEFTGEELLNGV
ncbi:hypothetical protein [Streptococcus varani]